MNYYNYGHGHGHGRYEMNNKNKSALFSDKPCGRCGVCDTPELWRGAAPRRDAEGGEQNQNDGGRGWFVTFFFIFFNINFYFFIFF